MTDTLEVLGSMLVMDLDGNFVSVSKAGTAVKVAFVVDASYEPVYTEEGEQVVSIIEGQV